MNDRRTIWKFPIAIGPKTTISVPANARVVLTAIDPASGGPAIWMELNPNARFVDRRFIVHGTGGEIEGDGGYPSPLHVGSVIDRAFVWHIFEERDGPDPSPTMEGR